MQREILKQINAVVNQSRSIVGDDQYQSMLQAADKGADQNDITGYGDRKK